MAIIILRVLALAVTIGLGSSLLNAASLDRPKDAQSIKICQTKPNMRYRIEVAQLLLTLTEGQYGKAEILPYSRVDPTQARCISLLAHGKVDLIFLGASEYLIDNFTSIQHDIHYGMLGYRVLMVHKESLAKFEKVHNLEQLRQHTGGFGSQWSDFKVFEYNKLPVVGTAIPSALLAMLNAGRFDYYHRGLHEAWVEIDQAKETFPDLVIEPKLALVYDYPVYFFVNKSNTLLAERFKQGVKLAKQSGAISALFTKYYGELAQKVQLSKRRLIPIDYPSPKGLPRIDTRIWSNH